MLAGVLTMVFVQLFVGKGWGGGVDHGVQCLHRRVMRYMYVVVRAVAAAVEEQKLSCRCQV